MNPPSFESGLMFCAKQVFLSVTPTNNFYAYFFDKSVHVVNSDISWNLFIRHWTFLTLRQKTVILKNGLISLY